MSLENLAKENSKIVLSEDKSEIVLTQKQKDIIIEVWNNRKEIPPSIEDLTFLAFDVKYDVRSKPALAIRKFLASRPTQKELKEISDKPFVSEILPKGIKKEEIELTDDQKEFICNQLKNNKKLIDIVRDLYHKPQLTPLHNEFRIVKRYTDTLDKKEYPVLDTFELKDYKAPTSLEKAAQKVNVAFGVNSNAYLNIIKVDDKPWEKNSKLKSNLYALMEMMMWPRFTTLCNRYVLPEERTLFENTYIGYIWEKPDLLPEELDLYINSATEIVNDLRLDKEIQYYSELLQDTATDNDGKKISLSIGEHINNLRSQKNDAQDKVQKIIKMLQGERSKKVENRVKENDSVLALIDFWKQKENRDKMIELAKKQEALVEEEVKRLEDVDQLKAMIAGITPNEATRG